MASFSATYNHFSNVLAHTGLYPVMKAFKREIISTFFQWKVTPHGFGRDALWFVMQKMNLRFSISFILFKKK